MKTNIFKKPFGVLKDGREVTAYTLHSGKSSVTAAAAESARQRSMNDGKGHLKPAVRKSSKDNSLVLSKKDMAMYRDTFPDLSDKEILALYKQANK